MTRTDDEEEEREIQELGDPDNWDLDSEEIQVPSRPPRAVVSVAFSREDFERVAARADDQDKPLSSMIREIVMASLPNTKAAFTVTIGGAEVAMGIAQAKESQATGAWQPAQHEGGTAVLAPG